MYGYSTGVALDQYGLMELREVTFAASPEVLRQISRFLELAADKMERGEFDEGREHIDRVLPAWSSLFPSKSIVVSHPDQDGRVC